MEALSLSRSLLKTVPLNEDVAFDDWRSLHSRFSGIRQLLSRIVVHRRPLVASLDAAMGELISLEEPDHPERVRQALGRLPETE